MRHGKGLNISFEVKGETKNKTIAPMLFFTFVENCFKHCCSNESGNSSIDIVISVSDNVIRFYTGNSKNGNIDGNVKKNAGGIGLKNVQKRLDIIYTNNYDLKITDIHNKFEVSLSITK
jgi:sensor histidine kinase YesM